MVMLKKRRSYMSFNISRCLTHLLFVFLIILVVVSTGVNAQKNTVYSTASIDFGKVGRGGSSEKDVILTNSGNNSSLTYSINFTYVMNTSGQLTATPSSGSIAVSYTHLTLSTNREV